MATLSYVLPPLICVLLHTRKMSVRPKLSKKLFFSNPTKQHNYTGDVTYQVLPGVISFPPPLPLAFKAKGSTVDHSVELKVCHLLQVRTKTSIEANQFSTVYTIFLDIIFFLVTHNIDHHVKHRTKGLLCQYQRD